MRAQWFEGRRHLERVRILVINDRLAAGPFQKSVIGRRWTVVRATNEQHGWEFTEL